MAGKHMTKGQTMIHKTKGRAIYV